jgi:hypothetical protein
MKVAIFLALALVALSSGRETGVRHFKGYKVFSVVTTTREQLEALRVLFFSDEYDFWTTPNGLGVTDIMAAPEQIPELVKVLEQHGMDYTIKFNDVEKLVEDERIANEKAYSGRIDWVSYPNYAAIVDFLTTINSNIATVSVIGQTTEGRDIHVVKISSGGPPKKSILIDSNIHAREWIAGATGTWIINELITNADSYATILEEVDIYVIPMINADGYEYSRTNDRMWRKTRSVNPGSSCVGCDPNRNFAFMWGGESTSPDPCSDIYHGPGPFSEPETQAIERFVTDSEAAGVQFLAYMTLHSYANMWLLPWGYTGGVYPPDFPAQLSLGQAAIAALRAVSGTVYETGQGADLLYGVGGASDDWAKDHGIKYTATIEMRGNSFVLPPEQIIPNSREVWAGLQVVIQRVIETVPVEEDPTPVETVTTCGGEVEASSARINFQLDADIPAGQNCIWVVKPTFDSTRVNLVSSGLLAGSAIYFTEFDAYAGTPGNQVQIANVGQDYTLSGNFFLVTLTVGAGANRGFSLDWYSSGFAGGPPSFSGYAALTTPTGSFSYPVGGGQYGNSENALFIISPDAAGPRTLTFTRMDVENDSSCSYDAVSVLTWVNNQYSQIAKFCGNSLPTPFNLPTGLALVTFTSDSSVTGTGFGFSWA